MKKLLYPFAFGLLCLTLVVSCKKDDPAATNSLIGSWKFTSATYSGCTDAANDGTETCTTDCGTLTFTATGYTYSAPGLTTDSGTYTVSGSTITNTPTAGTASTSTFTVVGSILTFVEVDDSSGCTETTVFTKV